ncbi:MAG: hypothetical protein U1C18_00590, partial [Patescibacteria group bacterium]|nr:hypothetical protein [Patescibacteria group bacterium]
MRYLIIAFMLLAPAAVSAGSSSVSAHALRVAGGAGSYASERMRVTNTDTMDQRYTIAFPASFADGASINPARFTLAPGESRDVVLRIAMPRQSARTHLAVMSQDVRSASSLAIANGIKIPVSFEVPFVAGISIRSQDAGAPSLALPNLAPV